MATKLKDELIDKVRALPPNKQQETLRLLDTLVSGRALNLTEPAQIANLFGSLLKRSTLACLQTPGTPYPRRARSILTFTSTERLSSSRESR